MARTEMMLLCGLLAGCPSDADPQDTAAESGTAEDAGTAAPTTDGGDDGVDDGVDDGADDGATTDPGTDEAGESDAGAESSGGTPTDGCGSDPGLSGAVEGAVDVEGQSRTFTLVVPEDYDPDRRYPFVFMFHGRGSNGSQFRMYNGVEAAGEGEAIFVYPDALPNDLQGGQTGWDLSANGIDFPFMDRLLADFDANLCIDHERIFATGHSHGGFFSNAMGCTRGDTIRAIAPVASGGPGAGCQEGSVAAWLAHHPDDNVVPIALGLISRDHWLETNGCSETTAPTDPEPCVAYEGCNEGHEVVWCEHMDDSMGLGPHSWPSFAGAAIWSFFSSY